MDVELAINEAMLAENLFSTARKNALAADVVERCRVKAEQVAREVGGRLRLDRPPEFYIRRGSDLVEGGDYLLVASRWTVDVPNSFDPERAAALSR
jgi:hypothetical protein